MMKTNTLEHHDHKDTIKPNTSFSAPTNLISVHLNHGQVLAPGPPDPSQCYVTGKVEL